ncbi:MAG: hypothetical protein LN569_05870 [Rickettsia endosymbiont of Labidopullus appendiculatus]|nr:hypothetical protein [Rickettsia endosymbiont of Labidopullus appendiculatus]
MLLQEHDKIFKKISVGKDNNLQNIRNLFNSDEINELIKFAEQQSQ